MSELPLLGEHTIVRYTRMARTGRLVHSWSSCSLGIVLLYTQGQCIQAGKTMYMGLESPLHTYRGIDKGKLGQTSYVRDSLASIFVL